MALGTAFVDSFLDVALFELGQESAVINNFVKQFPCHFGYRCCQSFYIIRTAGGIDHLVKMALFAKHDLLVTRYTFAELVRSLVLQVERQSFYRVYTCKGGTHGLSHRTQHIDMRVIYSLVVFRSLGVDHHLRAAAITSFGHVSFHDLGPQHAACTELGYLHEII